MTVTASRVLIVLAIVGAAFGAAFAIAKATTGEEIPSSGPKTLEPSDRIEVKGLDPVSAIPSLRPTRTSPDKTTTSPPSNNTSPRATNTSPPSNNTSPPPTTTSPPSSGGGGGGGPTVIGEG